MLSATNNLTKDAVGNDRSAAAFPAVEAARRALRASARRIVSPATGTCWSATATARVPTGG
jgi:hypothetical protein